MLLSTRLTLTLCAAAALVSLPAAGQSATLPNFGADALARADLRAATVHALELPTAPGEAFETRIELHGAELNLQLAPHSLRAPEFTVWAVGDDGITVFEPEAPATYRGEIENYPGSLVAASLVDGQLEGLMRLGADLPWMGIAPISMTEDSAAHDLHWIYEAQDARVDNIGCGTPHEVSAEHEPLQHPGSGPVQALGSAVEAQIAIDADVEFFNSNQSSVLNTEVDIEKVINGVSAIYEAQFSLEYRITHIIVRTAENDPYSTTNASSLLGQLRNHWTSQQSSITRDQTHLFTGKELNGSTIGIANLNSICGNFSGYGLSQSKFTGSLASRVALTAHELGHNWASSHCDGQSTCSIMCSALGSCTGVITSFGTSASNSINNKINNSSCIDPPVPGAAPVLSSVNPGAIGAYKDGQLIVTGNNLITATEVRVGGVAIDPLFLEVGNTQLGISDAIFENAGLQEIEVVTPAGTAGGVFVDIAPETGINFTAPLFAGGGQPLVLDWSGGPDNFYFLVISQSLVTVPFGGADLLLGNAVLTGLLGSAGASSFVQADPGSHPGLQVFLQVWFVDSTTLQFENATALKGIIYF